jgi:hypothetical protein
VLDSCGDCVCVCVCVCVWCGLGPLLYTFMPTHSARPVVNEAITALFVRKLLGYQLLKVRGDLLALTLETGEGNAQKQFEEKGTCSIEVACPALQSCLQSRGSRAIMEEGKPSVQSSTNE